MELGITSADIYLKGKLFEKIMLYKYVSLLEELLLIEHKILESNLPSEDKLKILDIMSRVKMEVLNEIFRAEGYDVVDKGIVESREEAVT